MGPRSDPSDACLLSELVSFDVGAVPERLAGLGRPSGEDVSAFITFWSLEPEGVRKTVVAGSCRLEVLVWPLTIVPTRAAL